MGFVLYIIFNSINFMDNYSKESIEQFKVERKYKILFSVILLIILYFCGTFNKIF